MKVTRSLAEAIYWKQLSLRLRDLVAYSCCTVPYYREVMDERALRPEDIATPAHLRKLPVLSRARLAASQDRLLSSEADTATLRLVNRREPNTFRPALVSTYSNAIHLITREAARWRMRLDGLRAVQATSKPLPPSLRRRIKQTLHCEVYDKYGMRESNLVAHESPDHDGMLIQAVQPCPEGVPGEVVVTPLNSRSMPLPRYETSHVADLQPQAENALLPFPRLSPVAGRLQLERISHHTNFDFAIELDVLDRMPDSVTGKLRANLAQPLTLDAT
jgi:phenylacetate-coenzyme A ligase PaaK-like adenylate-forming protein